LPSNWSLVELGSADVPLLPLAGPPVWQDWTVPVPGPLREIAAPTEVVVLTAAGRLHLLEFPSGRARSTVVPDVSSDGQLAVSASAIAVPRFADVVLLSGDPTEQDATGPAAAELSPNQTPRVVARGGLDEFLVTGGRTGPVGPEQQWLLAADGRVTDVSGGAFADDPLRNHVVPAFVGSGELVTNGPGGVEAVAADGSVRSIADGRLVAAGANHVVVRRCDDAGACDHVVVDVATGVAAPAALEVLDRYRYWDFFGRVSPDGRFLQYADWRRERPIWRLVDVASGAVTDLGDAGPMRIADAWAPDSTGVFLADGERLVFHAVDGRVGAIAGLGPIRSVATRPTGD
jgi:hypothetical protein